MKFEDLKIGDYVCVTLKDKFYTKKHIGFIWRKGEKSKHIFIKIGNYSDIKWRDYKSVTGFPYKNVIDIYKINHHSIDRDKILHKFKRYEMKNSMVGWKHPYAKQIKDRQEEIKKAPPEKKIQLLVERLAELNCAGSLMGLGDELTTERQLIVELLSDENYIELAEKGSGGFQFVGKESDKHKKIYLESFNGF